ncbi:MAG: TRZ/ATZ family hydrolase, partial [Candidatus Competibacteraceae bacterium]|nr:TRZ/ATZ family hydrolase [Candidatus Competibacteraceae bacterium]
MQPIDLIINARWVIPVEPEGCVWEDHSVAVDQGRILAILPRKEAETHYRAQTQLDRMHHALIPGLVNTHTHAAMNLLRGLADDLPLMTWLQQHIWPAESRWVSESFVRDGTESAVAEMLRGGITCFGDMYFFPEAVAEVVKKSGMRACVGLIVVDFPSAWAQNAEDYLQKGLALHDTLRDDPRVRTAFAPHAPYTVSPKTLERIGVLAHELDIPIHIHVHETAAEVEQSVSQHGQRPLAGLQARGLLSPRLIAVHMTQLNADEIQQIADTGVNVVHCPESNLKLASGFCPVAQLDAAGVNVALGTDGAASNNDLNMFGEMRSAALLGKGLANDAAVLPAQRILRMATLNGARALGLEQHIGSLEPGKWADITAVDLGTLEAEPVYQPISQLVYATDRHQVSDVWVAGRQLLADRKLTTLDIDAIVHKVRDWADKIKLSN